MEKKRRSSFPLALKLYPYLLTRSEHLFLFYVLLCPSSVLFIASALPSVPCCVCSKLYNVCTFRLLTVHVLYAAVYSISVFCLACFSMSYHAYSICHLCSMSYHVCSIYCVYFMSYQICSVYRICSMSYHIYSSLSYHVCSIYYVCCISYHVCFIYHSYSVLPCLFYVVLYLLYLPCLFYIRHVCSIHHVYSMSPVRLSGCLNLVIHTLSSLCMYPKCETL